MRLHIAFECKPNLTPPKFRIKSVDDFLGGDFMEGSDDDLEEEDGGTVGILSSAWGIF